MSFHSKFLYHALTLLGFVLFVSCNGKARVDLIVHHAKIYTVDSAFSMAEAMAVKGGKIVALGKNDDILSRYEAGETRDAQGKAVFPGFIDAHAHFVGYGMSLLQVNLEGTNSWEECIGRIREFVTKKNIPAGAWIQGRGWDQNDWAVKEFPNKDLLDKHFPANPIVLVRIDGHALIANQQAMELAGIKPGQQIEGGTVETKEGRLTGIFIDNAEDLVFKVVPGETPEKYRKGLSEAEANCFAVGLTTIVDCGLSRYAIEAIDSLQKKGVLKMRLNILLSDDSLNYAHYLKAGPYKTDRLNVNGFKLYADGALGSRGACLLKPYSDKPGWQGFLLKDRKYFEQILPEIYKTKFQACTHAIGDSGNRMILEVYAKILGGKNDRRWRVEHAQVVNEADFKLFYEYSIIPSVQPTHATSDMYWAGQRLGPEREKGAYAYKRLLQQNNWIPLGTDFPVEDISPFKTFFAAVARQDAKGYPEKGYQPENALSREETLKGMTIWAAKGSFEEKEKGSLEPGKFADFILLDTDIMTCPVNEVLKTKVLATYVNGEKVYGKR
ncbi:MAG: amidohydrolase [Chitinophagaceae bacterium]|nr:amidohydrolase [Chitinophagaceae bacterium]